jgi:hypothetical protein
MADALAGVRSTLDTLGIPYRVIPALGDLLAAPASDDPASSVRAPSVRPAPLDLAASPTPSTTPPSSGSSLASAS